MRHDAYLPCTTSVFIYIWYLKTIILLLNNLTSLPFINIDFFFGSLYLIVFYEYSSYNLCYKLGVLVTTDKPFKAFRVIYNWLIGFF